jgi:spore coat protein A, manganese oxidase
MVDANLSRRDLAKISVLAGAAVALPLERSVSGAPLRANRIAETALPQPFTVPFAIPKVIHPFRSDGTTDYFKVTMKPALAEILPGLTTPVWGYNGQVPGPTFKIRQGRPAVVRQANRLPRVDPVLRFTPWTSVHLHGSASAPQFDGYASDITNPGQFKDYH